MKFKKILKNANKLVDLVKEWNYDIAIEEVSKERVVFFKTEIQKVIDTCEILRGD